MYGFSLFDNGLVPGAAGLPSPRLRLPLAEDQFKRCNECDGHEAADECLRRVEGACDGLRRPQSATTSGEAFLHFALFAARIGAMRTASSAPECVARVSPS